MLLIPCYAFSADFEKVYFGMNLSLNSVNNERILVQDDLDIASNNTSNDFIYGGGLHFRYLKNIKETWYMGGEMEYTYSSQTKSNNLNFRDAVYYTVRMKYLGHTSFSLMLGKTVCDTLWYAKLGYAWHKMEMSRHSHNFNVNIPRYYWSYDQKKKFTAKGIQAGIGVIGNLNDYFSIGLDYSHTFTKTVKTLFYDENASGQPPFAPYYRVKIRNINILSLSLSYKI